MKKYFLLPHRFNAIGWVLIGVALLVTMLDCADALPAFSSKVFSVVPDFSFGNKGFIVTNDSWYDEIEMVAGYLGLYFVAMSALKEEDELTLLLRLRSLMWAFTANALLFIAFELLFYGFPWLYVMMYQGMLIFVLFILRFHWEIHKMRAETHNEKEEWR